MPRALLYYLAQTWATDPHHHPRPLAQARKKGTPAMSDRFAAHLPPAIRNLPARTRRLTIGAAAAITIGAAVAIPALLAAAARPGNAVSGRPHRHRSIRWRSARTARPWPAPAATARCGCGTWPPAARSATPHRPHRRGSASVAFSPDGKTLATGRRRRHGAAVGRGHRPPDRRPPHRPHRRRSARWRSARTARPWPAAATTARCGCGTWPPAARSATRSPATPARSARWRSARTARPWPRQPTTRRCGCGTWPPAARSASP